MMKPVLLCCLLIIAATINAQNSATGLIKGSLRDTTLHQVLKGATVSLLTKDSSALAQVISDDKGNFLLNNISAGKYILKISYSSYSTRYSPFTIDSTNTALNAGIIYLQPEAHELATVTVETPPIVIKKDTVEFNAGMFNTKPEATAEDLLKKLPGVDVDKSGNIKAQGETVQRVLVNGKRFFGDDPKTATENLPSDIIERVQVFDDLSDQSAFTGFDDGNRVKTINIITKKNSGYFGKFTGGAGDKKLYDITANLNKFDGNEQVSFIGQLNNTNKQNFTIQDILGSSGANSRGGGFGGGGGTGGGNTRGGAGGQAQQLQSLNANSNNTGIITTAAAGLNYRNTFGKNTTLYGSYFYNNLLTSKEQKSLTENFYTNDTLFDNQNQSSLNRIVNQRINLNIETQVDSNNSFIIRPNVAYQQTTNSSSAVTNTTQGKTSINNANASADSYNEGYNGNIDALYRHRFAKRGRTFSLDVNGSGNNNSGNGSNYSITNYFSDNVIDSTYKINQHYTSKTSGQGISTTAEYTEPVGKHAQLEADYNYNYSRNNADRFTYNYDSMHKSFTALDSLLTNTYNNTYQSNRVSLAYRYQKDKLNINLGNGVQFGDLTSINTSKDFTINQHYINIYPTANFNYRFTRTSNLRFNYSGRTAQPSVSQLEPVIDNSDPLNVQIGNPSLKQSFTNSFRALYTSFDRVNFRNIFATVNASFTTNQVSSNLIHNYKTGVDTISYANLNGTYNISAFFNYGFRIKKPASNLNFTTNLTDVRSASLINDTINFTQNYTLGETVKLTTNLKKNFDMNFSATPTYNIARYSIKSAQNANYFSQVLSTEATYYTTGGFILNASFDYTAYSGRAAGYNTSVPLLNAAIAKQFLKKKQAEFRLSVFDLLNKNVSITRNVTENYIQDVQTKVLTRYVLLSFTYNLRNFNKPQQSNRMYGHHGDFMPPPPDGNGNNNGSAPPPAPPQ